MRFIFCFIIAVFSIDVFACEDQLIHQLSIARQEVAKNFKAQSPCYNAAMVGRTKGLPGCYPPEAFDLKDLLTPILTKAQQVCKKECRAQGKANSCLSFIKNNNLKTYGIDSLINQLQNQGLPVDSDFEVEESTSSTIEI